MDKYINKIFFGDSLDLLKQLPDNSVDICITSPPYKTKDKYTEFLIENVSYQLYRVLKPNSLFFLDFGHLKEEKFRPFYACSAAMTKGFKLNDTITWVKNHYTPLNGKKNLNNLTEFIFLLYKGDIPDLDRLSIGIPYQDKSNVKRYAGGKDIKCGGNVWYINIPTITKKSQRLHKDEFPQELSDRCIKLSGLKSGIVLDPFGGSFTTSVSAQKLGLDWISADLNYKNCQIGQDRFFKEFNQEIEIVRL